MSWRVTFLDEAGAQLGRWIEGQGRDDLDILIECACGLGAALVVEVFE